jgi:iron complex transport system ATP-binding protein
LLAGRRTDTLSGGELARVHCARAFATGAPLLIADEPTAALDPRQQLRILDLVRRFVAQGGGALVVLHDIALAARYATRLLWMCGGKIVADGPTGDTLTAERIASVYGVQARILADGVILDGPLPG